MILFFSWIPGGPNGDRLTHALKVLRTKDDSNYMAYILCQKKFLTWKASVYSKNESWSCDTSQSFSGTRKNDCPKCRKILGL